MLAIIITTVDVVVIVDIISKSRNVLGKKTTLSLLLTYTLALGFN